MLSYIDYCFIYLLIICFSLFFIYKNRGGRGIIFCPFGLYSVFYCFVFFVIPILQFSLKVGRFGYLIDYPYSQMIVGVNYAFLYFVSSMIAFLIFGKRNSLDIVNKSLKSIECDSDLLMKVLTVAFLVCSGLFFLKFSSLLINDFSYFMRDRTTLLRGHGYITKGMSLFLPVLFLVMFRLLKIGSLRNKYTCFGVFIFLIALIVNLFLGSRLIAFMPLLYIYLIYVVSVGFKKFELKHLVVSIIVVVSIFSIISIAGDYRKGILRGNYAHSVDSGSVVVSVVTELFTSMGHLELLSFAVDQQYRLSHAMGKTYLAALVSPVPRSLWPQKPLGAGPLLANLVRPGAWVLGQEGNSSLTTGGPLEAFLNFGLLGIPLVGWLHGLLIAFISNLALRVNSEMEAAIFFIGLFACAEMFVIGEFLGVFVRVLFLIMPIWVTFILYKKKKPFYRRFAANESTCQ